MQIMQTASDLNLPIKTTGYRTERIEITASISSIKGNPQIKITDHPTERIEVIGVADIKISIFGDDGLEKFGQVRLTLTFGKTPEVSPIIDLKH
jgi:hypothetical protein